MRGGPKRFDEPLAVEIEIRAEKARALGRTARAFEQELARLRAFESQLSTLRPRERMRLEAEHRALRKSAARRLWFLVVHREALGLRRHDDVYDAYGVPRSLLPNP